MVSETGIVKYSVVDAEIATWKDIYLHLVIDDLNDKEQFDSVHSARMVVKNKRVQIEKERKALKADALAWGRKVDGEAKKIFAKIEPIESHLMSEEQKVIDEQNRIKDEEEQKERERLKNWYRALESVNCIKSLIELAQMTDEEFDTLLFDKTEEYNYEQDRLKKEAEDKAKAEAEAAEARRVENERFEKIRKEQQAEAERLEKIRAEQKAKEDELRKEQERIETERRVEQERKEREEFERKAKEQARIQAEVEAKEKAEREVREKAERERIDAEEKARQEALRPDKERLLFWLGRIETELDDFPDVTCADSKERIDVIRQSIGLSIVEFRSDVKSF